MSALVQSKRTAEIVAIDRVEQGSTGRSLNGFIHYSLIGIIVLMAIPYGSVELWWKALFQCVVFLLAAASIISNGFALPGWQIKLLLPLVLLVGFSLVQTIPFGTSAGFPPGVAWTISADPYQTRLFALYLFSLLILGWLTLNHVKDRNRVQELIDAVVGIAFLSALFGLLREFTQQSDGFFLSGLRAGFGYGQFINANHFAYLMEMALGLILGATAAGGLRGARLFAYLASAVPIFLGLTFSGSRGGLVSVIFLMLGSALFFFRRSRKRRDSLRERPIPRAIKSGLIQILLAAFLLTVIITTVVYVGGERLTGKLATVGAEFDRRTADEYVLRASTWRATWNLIKDRPIAGTGFGGYWIAITKFHDASGEITPQQAHNDYLELLASGGAIGFVLALWFLFEFIRAMRRNLKSDDRQMRPLRLAALISILGVAIHSIVDFGLHIPINAIVFVTIASLVVVSVQGEDRLPKEETLE